MIYYKNTIRAKSTDENYNKEISGIKNNTVRKVSRAEAAKLEEKIKQLLNNEKLFIQIEKAETGEIFSREITDITHFEFTQKFKLEKPDENEEIQSYSQEFFIYIISFKND